MNPDDNLEEVRELVQKVLQSGDQCPEDGEFTQEQKEDLSHDALRLAEPVEALDAWISSGGFLPQAWRKEDDSGP